MKLRGIIPPVVTPMTPDQDINLEALRFRRAAGIIKSNTRHERSGSCRHPKN